MKYDLLCTNCGHKYASDTPPESRIIVGEGTHHEIRSCPACDESTMVNRNNKQMEPNIKVTNSLDGLQGAIPGDMVLVGKQLHYYDGEWRAVFGTIPLINLTSLGEEAHNTAVEKGWCEEEPNLHTEILLVHSELSEAVEADRIGKVAEPNLAKNCWITMTNSKVCLRNL